ncbi:hypothetical protein GQ53DRAFT_722205 [Thozetella sp. PMI_491]|nr:hypothetical protein GQ53DRAFT_722205 [Thozetella sp. PMI_491]
MRSISIFACWVGISGHASASVVPQLTPRFGEGVHPPNNEWIQGRQAGGLSSLTTSIKAIEASVNATTDAVTPFEGGTIKGLIGLIKIDEGVVELGNSIDTTTKIADNTPTLSVNESTTLGVQFLGLQPKITDLLSRLQTKRPEFDKAGFKILDVRSLIRDDLTSQQKQADTLGTALVKVLDPALQPLATPVTQQIQGNFSQAVTAFSGRGGKIKIPAKAVPALSNLLADVGKALGIKVNAVAQGATAQAAGPDPATIAPATDAELAASDPAVAEQSAQAAIAATPDADLDNLGDDENDLSGIPPLVLAVLRKYDII